MDIIRAIENQHMKEDVPDFRPGDNVKVHYRITEGNRERIQVFQGDVISRKGKSNRETFTVRKGRVRRAKLYYLRDKVGKAAKIKEASRL